MLKVLPVNSLDLKDAAAFLGIHPNTLQERAKAKIIPGVKIGKEWRFLDADLIEYIRGKYKTEDECQYTNEKTANTGGTQSPIPMGDSELENQLERLKKQKRSESTTRKRRNSGRSKLRVVNSTTP